MLDAFTNGIEWSIQGCCVVKSILSKKERVKVCTVSLNRQTESSFLPSDKQSRAEQKRAEAWMGWK